MKYNDLLNELFDLLDENQDIKRIKTLKGKLINNLELQNNLSLYKETRSVESKKKLYENQDYVKYLESENNIRLLIADIKKKFNFTNRKC